MGASRHLSAVDTAWLRMEEADNAVDVTAILEFERRFTEQELRTLLEERLVVSERFRERVIDAPAGLGRPRWEREPHFTIDAHLHHETLPPGSGRAELAEIVSCWMGRPFDWTLSPWRVVRIDGVQGGTALLTQVHHCMGDGFALMQVLLDMADGRAEPASSASGAGPGARWTRASTAVPARRIARDAVRALARLLSLSFDAPSALRGPLSGRRRAAWSSAIPLDLVRSSARARGCTVNDVLTAALTGALRRYLAERGDRIDELAIRAIVPVNLRPAGVPFDLEHGNWFALAFVDLPIATREPEARVAAIHATIERIKASQEPLVSLAMLSVIGVLPTAIGRALDVLFARKSSVVVTNVPGPRERLAFLGVPLRAMMFWVPHPGRLAAGISILSYAGEIRVGARSDVGVVRDPERIVELLEHELRAITSATASSTPAHA